MFIIVTEPALGDACIENTLPVPECEYQTGNSICSEETPRVCACREGENVHTVNGRNYCAKATSREVCEQDEDCLCKYRNKKDKLRKQSVLTSWRAFIYWLKLY